ncbi:MAG: cytochrome c oxidase subunit 3 [Colwellia sp.]|nr:cytochrome c oxidase subunit 3 [Colwellia sp.]
MMKIWQTLTVKPWLTSSEGIVQSDMSTTEFIDTENNKGPGKTALKFFLAIVTLLFFLITITFLSRSQYPDFHALAGEPWLPFTKPIQLWINTACLLLASISLQTAVSLVKKQHIKSTEFAILLATFGSGCFVIGQILVWQQLSQGGFYVNSDPANSYFYLYTSLHGLHIVGGLVALALVSYQFFQDKNFIMNRKNLSLCAIYWHYLLLIWLFLFALLTATPETYKTIALICGF